MSFKHSIIIPLYREDLYIDECLGSVSNEIKNALMPSDSYEIIVVSDGASEKAINNVLSHKNEFYSLRLVEMNHKGVSAARNLGIKEAKGEYISFIDADDRMSGGFLNICNELLKKQKDLYIFGIKRIEGDKIEYWKLDDKEYNAISDFADEYIRTRNLLVYSNCNKLYLTRIIKDNDIKFNETIHFGEDRLFNYEYIKHCNNVITSSAIKHDYIKRNEISQSTKYFDNYFGNAIKLHKEKIKCFIGLSKNVSDDDVTRFVTGDLIKEIENALGRFNLHFDEEQENIILINDYLSKASLLSKIEVKGIFDNWYKSEEGKTIVFNKIRDGIKGDFGSYKKIIYS